jgi:hypothetical protein
MDHGKFVFSLVEHADLDFWGSEENNCKDVGDTWRYEGAFVSGQHLRAWWRPRAKFCGSTVPK